MESPNSHRISELLNELHHFAFDSQRQSLKTRNNSDATTLSTRSSIILLDTPTACSSHTLNLLSDIPTPTACSSHTLNLLPDIPTPPGYSAHTLLETLTFTTRPPRRRRCFTPKSNPALALDPDPILLEESIQESENYTHFSSTTLDSIRLSLKSSLAKAASACILFSADYKDEAAHSTFLDAISQSIVHERAISHHIAALLRVELMNNIQEDAENTSKLQQAQSQIENLQLQLAAVKEQPAPKPTELNHLKLSLATTRAELAQVREDLVVERQNAQNLLDTISEREQAYPSPQQFQITSQPSLPSEIYHSDSSDTEPEYNARNHRRPSKRLSDTSGKFLSTSPLQESENKNANSIQHYKVDEELLKLHLEISSQTPFTPSNLAASFRQILSKNSAEVASLISENTELRTKVQANGGIMADLLGEKECVYQSMLEAQERIEDLKIRIQVMTDDHTTELSEQDALAQKLLVDQMAAMEDVIFKLRLEIDELKLVASQEIARSNPADTKSDLENPTSQLASLESENQSISSTEPSERDAIVQKLLSEQESEMNAVISQLRLEIEGLKSQLVEAEEEKRSKPDDAMSEELAALKSQLASFESENQSISSTEPSERDAIVQKLLSDQEAEMNAVISQLRLEIEGIKSQLVGAEEEKRSKPDDAMSEELAALKSQIESLELELDLTQESHSAELDFNQKVLFDQRDVMNRVIEKLEVKVEGLNSRLFESQQALSNIPIDTTALEEIEALKLQLGYLESKLQSTFESHAKELSERCNKELQLTHEKNELADVIVVLRSDIELFKSQMEELQQALSNIPDKTTSEELEALRSQVASLESKVQSSLLSHNAELSKRDNDSEMQLLYQRKKLETVIDELGTEIVLFKSQIMDSTNAVESMRKDLDIAMTEKKDLAEIVTRITKALTKSQRCCEGQVDEIAQLKVRIRDNDLELLQMAEKIASSVVVDPSKDAAYAEEVERLQMMLVTLKTENVNLMESQDNEEHNSEMLRKQLESLTVELNNLTQIQEKNESTIKSLRQEVIRNGVDVGPDVIFETTTKAESLDAKKGWLLGWL